MLRIMKRNSTERAKARDLVKLEENLERIGYTKSALLKTRERAVEKHNTPKVLETPVETKLSV